MIFMPTESICETPYLVTDDIEGTVQDLQINPYSLVVVEESPDWKGELVFQPFSNEQGFYEQHQDWLSRYLILNQPFVLADFVQKLQSDGYTVLFSESCRPILDGYERWRTPLDIEGFHAPNGGSLYPYQTFSINRALERIDAENAPERTYFCGWCPGAGKAEPVSEPVLTPQGWRTMGDLRPGDYVIGSNGRATLVVSVHPQGVQPVWRVEMNDGTFVRCNADHLWNVRRRSTRTRKPSPSSPTRKKREEAFVWKTLTTKEIAETVGQRRRWQLPVLEPVVFDHQEALPLDPYVLGVFLGDGSWAKEQASVTTDKWIIEQLGWSLRSHYRDHEYCGVAGVPQSVRDQLRNLGLGGLRSWEKFVPSQYLTASIEDRLALLQGLLDTDGSAGRTGIEFSTTSRGLVDSVADLVRGLGGKATVSSGKISKYTNAAGEKILGRESWRIHISMMMTPFRLPRKLIRWNPPDKYPPLKTIVSIVQEGVDEDQVCITVDAPDSLYVTRGHTVTHNSVFACAGAQEVINRGEADIVLAFTLMKLKTNLAHFFQQTTSLETVVNDGPAAKRKARYEKGSQVFVLNYDKAWADFDYLLPLIQGKRVLFIFDECQKILTDGTKNRSRKHLDKLIQATDPIIWPMSATVVSHSPFKYRDVFSIGAFRNNPLGTKTEFDIRYVKQRRFFQIKTKRGGTFQQIFYDWDLPKLHEIRHRVADRCHNVRKTDPGIKENFKGMQTVVIPVQMSKEDRELYDNICEHARGAVEREESLAPYYRLLRYVCNTPESLQHTNEKLGQALSQDFPRLATSDHCAKLEMLLDQVESIRDSGDKVVVFCQWTHLGVLLLERHLAARKIRYVLHYGVGQSDAESQRAQREFKSDPDITVFLSSDAGAFGLSFQEARYVINYDIPYSYDTLTQRNNRIDRADSYLDGLTSYIYVTEDTVEERIWAQNNQRRELASATLGTSEMLSYGEEKESKTLQWLIFGEEKSNAQRSL